MGCCDTESISAFIQMLNVHLGYTSQCCHTITVTTHHRTRNNVILFVSRASLSCDLSAELVTLLLRPSPRISAKTLHQLCTEQVIKIEDECIPSLLQMVVSHANALQATGAW